ncbi:MAG: hypothetical protein GF387_01665 [Candidatus Portnoybacteria bacterium]|nr:hypothetical protein [Candidatus Portnoybacteria bacterium]
MFFYKLFWYNRIMNLSLVEKSILATVLYYDVLNRPLTGFEIFKYLINPVHIFSLSGGSDIEPVPDLSLFDVLSLLEGPGLSRYINQRNGFFGLKERVDDLVDIRIKRQKISEYKWKKARRVVFWMQAVPFIRMIAVSGSVAKNNAREESDIDLFVVVRKGRIWMVRFFLALFLHVLGKRRHGKKSANRFCLNHFVTDSSLRVNYPSLYTAQLYAFLTPLFDRGGVLADFFRENDWLGRYLYSSNFVVSDQRKVNNRVMVFFAKIQEFVLGGFLGNWLERLFRFFEKKYQGSPVGGYGRIVVDDNSLEFHPNSPEKKILDKYNESVLRLGLDIHPEKNSGLFKIREV